MRDVWVGRWVTGGCLLLKKTRQNYLCKVVLCSAHPPGDGRRQAKRANQYLASIRCLFGLPSCLPVRCLCSRRTRCACPEPRREPGNIGIVLLPSWSSAKPFSPRSTLAFLFVLFLFLSSSFPALLAARFFPCLALLPAYISTVSIHPCAHPATIGFLRHLSI